MGAGHLSTNMTRISLRDRFGGHLAVARISNLPTVVTNVMAGVALAGVGWDARLIPLAAAMAMLYTAGMYLNDVCDYAIDEVERPDRPLVKGLVTRWEAAVVALLLFGGGLVCLAFVSTEALILGIVLVGFIVAYNAWHKSNPGAPFLMAVCRALVYITAGWGVMLEWDPRVPAIVVLVLLYVIGLTVIARRAARIGPLRIWPIAVLLLLPVPWFLSEGSGILVWIAAIMVAIWVLWSLRSVRAGLVARGIMHLIAGIALVDVVILLLMQQTGMALVALGLFAVTVLWQRYISGT